MADISDIISAVVSNQASGVQSSAASLVLKKSLDAQRDAVLTILGVPNASSQGNLSPGVGQNLDASA